MVTETANIVGNNITYPPSRRKPKQQLGGVLTFKIDVMRHDPELLSAVTSLQATYNAVEAEASQREKAELEEEREFYIVGYQRAHEVFLEAERAYYTALSNNSQIAKNELESASREYDELKALIDEDEDVLLTSAQTMERVERLKQARERLDAAAIAESRTTMSLNNLNNERNRAATAEADWKALAHQVKAELQK